ncbi:hypothetical protein HK098_005669 [Nowakowskiella sp. JEL0407]|nr:hypothetical protein HK098_005669 [Nowakowskiella sp. JEL0407]
MQSLASLGSGIQGLEMSDEHLKQFLRDEKESRCDEMCGKVGDDIETIVFGLELVSNLYSSSEPDDVDEKPEVKDTKMETDEYEDIDDDEEDKGGEDDEELVNDQEALRNEEFTEDEKEKSLYVGPSGLFPVIFKKITEISTTIIPVLSTSTNSSSNGKHSRSLLTSFQKLKVRGLNSLLNLLLIVEKSWCRKYVDDLRGVAEFCFNCIVARVDGLKHSDGDIGMMNDDENVDGEGDDVKELDAAIGLLWGVIRAVDNLSDPNLKIVPSEQHLDYLLSLLPQPTNSTSHQLPPTTQTKLFLLFSILGKSLPTLPQHQTLGTTILTTIEESKSIVLISEALNCMFDVYGDKEYWYDYEVFVKGGWVVRLKKCLESVKNKVGEKLENRVYF